MIVPLDSTADCSIADVVWVSVLSLSLKLIVPDSVCSVVESVVLVNSVKLPVADEEVKTGVWLVMEKSLPAFAVKAPPHEDAATRLIGPRDRTISSSPDVRVLGVVA